jgi:hypothetical protein
MEGETAETTLLMMWEPLYSTLNAGADRPTQHTAGLCLLEWLTLLQGQQRTELIDPIAPKLYTLILV